ncbi:hypothetical protein LX36DRAFT_233161 [Colletotrichum falcatum]|nr:hypothetical protein LX36DRAFT_233161 [Colletotrichum falcatum]
MSLLADIGGSQQDWAQRYGLKSRNQGGLKHGWYSGALSAPPPSLPLSLSLTHTHTHTLSLSLCRTRSRGLTLVMQHRGPCSSASGHQYDTCESLSRALGRCMGGSWRGASSQRLGHPYHKTHGPIARVCCPPKLPQTAPIQTRSRWVTRVCEEGGFGGMAGPLRPEPFFYRVPRRLGGITGGGCKSMHPCPSETCRFKQPSP